MKILISGGGIAGHTLAYWLARTKLKPAITVLERSPTPRETGQAVDLHIGPAIEIVKRMGIHSAIREMGTTETGTQFHKQNDRPFLDMMRKDGFSFTNEYEILRADLSTLLSNAAERFDNVSYIYGDSIKSIDQHEKGVKVTWTSGSERDGNFDLVVGADGTMSKTRSMIFDESVLKDHYKFLGQYVAFFTIPSEASDDKLWHIYNRTKGKCIMIRPHRTPETVGVYLLVTMPKHEQRDPVFEQALNDGSDAAKKALRDHFADFGGQAPRVLDGMDLAKDFYFARAAQVILPQWTTGRTALVGDAAWATFGIGTTLAVVGAYHLAGELSKIQSSEEVPQALKRYEEVFRPIYKKVMDLPPGYPQVLSPQTWWGLWLRDTLFWILIKSRLLNLLGGDELEKVVLPKFDWLKDDKVTSEH